MHKQKRLSRRREGKMSKRESGTCPYCGRTWSDHPNMSQACKETCEAEAKLAAAEARCKKLEALVWHVRVNDDLDENAVRDVIASINQGEQ